MNGGDLRATRPTNRPIGPLFHHEYPEKQFMPARLTIATSSSHKVRRKSLLGLRDAGQEDRTKPADKVAGGHDEQAADKVLDPSIGIEEDAE